MAWEQNHLLHATSPALLFPHHPYHSSIPQLDEVERLRAGLKRFKLMSRWKCGVAESSLATDGYRWFPWDFDCGKAKLES